MLKVISSPGNIKGEKIFFFFNSKFCLISDKHKITFTALIGANNTLNGKLILGNIK